MGRRLPMGWVTLAFDIEGNPDSMILELWLDKDGVRQVGIVPAIVQPGGYPRLAAPTEVFRIKQTIYQLSNQLQINPPN